jgi:hypothetical protein
MNNSILSQSFLLFLLVIIFESCMTEPILLPKVRLSPEAAEAQLWYDKQGNSEGIRIVSPNGQKQSPLSPDWEMVFFNEDEQCKISEVNLKPIRKTLPANEKGEILSSTQRFITVSPECFKKYQETDDRRYMAFNIRLIIRTNKETNEKDGFVMVVVPDLSYLETHLDNPFKNISYIERDKEFSGFVHYYNMEGDFVNAWKYTNGIPRAIRLRVEK